MIQVSINGENRIVNGGLTVEGLLKDLELDPRKVAVEVNFKIISKPDYNSLKISSRDKIEIIQLVGGGEF